MNTQAMHEVTIETQAGKMTFPQVVRRLLEIDVESYFVDLAAGRKTYYLRDGETYTEPMTLSLDPIAGKFSSSRLVAALARRRLMRFAIRSSSSGRRQPVSSATGRSLPASA